ncbi:hypothetical protein [Prevotella melaninogenica]|uniref:hypothetical protein n=1 Tax=Prevotella melaninogenica TaxID=28132 RepID=UPI00201385E1|nr:hypothetical protein [Prevotella melaninogenica]
MKRILILCFIVLGWLHSAFAQVTFNIDGFSEQYYGKVYFSDTTQTASAGWVEVYDRATKRSLFMLMPMNYHSIFMITLKRHI